MQLTISIQTLRSRTTTDGIMRGSNGAPSGCRRRAPVHHACRSGHAQSGLVRPRVPPRAVLSRPSACSTLPPHALCQRLGLAHDHVRGSICMRLRHVHRPMQLRASSTKSRAAKTAIRKCWFYRTSGPHLYTRPLTIVSSRFRSRPTTQ